MENRKELEREKKRIERERNGENAKSACFLFNKCIERAHILTQLLFFKKKQLYSPGDLHLHQLGYCITLNEWNDVLISSCGITRKGIVVLVEAGKIISDSHVMVTATMKWNTAARRLTRNLSDDSNLSYNINTL